MIGKREQRLLFYITGILDAVLVTMLFSTMSTIGHTWIISTLILHALFVYGLTDSERHRRLLDILHIFVFLVPTMALFVDNLFIKMLCVGFLIVIQYFWSIENRCILNEKEGSEFGYGDELDIYVKILMLGLLYQSALGNELI